MTWRIASLGEIAEIAAGGVAPQERACFVADGQPFVRAGSLVRLLSGDLETDLERLSNAAAKQHRLRLFPKDTILFAKSGMSATKGLVYQLRSPAYVVNHLAAITPGQHVLPSYLRHALTVFSPVSLVRDSSYPSLRLSDIRRLSIPLPPIAEQRRIATLLDTTDAIVRKRRLVLEFLEEISRSVYVQSFGDPVSSFRWTRQPIGSIGDVTTGNTPPRVRPEYYAGESIEWIKPDNLATGSYYATRAAETLSDDGRSVARLAECGAVLVTCIAGSLSSIGNCAMIDRSVAFNQQINALAVVQGNAHFVYAQLRFAKTLVQEAATGGMTRLVSKSRFEAVELASPPRAAQDQFADTMVRMRRLYSSQERALLLALELAESVRARAFDDAL